MARIAESLLKGKHKDQVRSLMHGGLVDLSDWESKMTTKYPETATLHFHRQEPEWTCAGLRDASPELQRLGDKEGNIKCDGQTADKGSLFCALSFFFEHFAHDVLLKAFAKPKVPIGTPKSLDVMKNIPAADQTPANFLRWLSILIGDLHQPLHWLREKDYGRELKISYKDKEYTLYQFWEEELPKMLPAAPTGQALDDKYKAESEKWGHKQPTEHFREWAKEVAEQVCTQVYGVMEVNHADGSRNIDNPFMADDALVKKWSDLVENFATLGGIRLAFVLNEILEHKRHKNAHLDGRALFHKHHHRNWKANFGTNALIAVFIVPLTLLALRFHLQLGSGGLIQLVRGHLKL